MAILYVWSGAAGAGTGANWTNAYITLGAAYSGKSAGDIFYMAHDHVETQGSIMALTSPGSAANPCFVLAVNRAGSVPPVAADLVTRGAQMTTTATNQINLGGSVVYHGIIFSSGAALSIGTNNAQFFMFRDCALRMSGPSGGSTITMGSASAWAIQVEMINTTMQFNVVGQLMSINNSAVKWMDTSNAITGSVFPTTFVQGASGRGGSLVCRGVDLSSLGSGKTIVGAVANAAAPVFTFMDCKLNASVTKAAATVAAGSSPIFIRCGSSGNTDIDVYQYAGSLIKETTIIRTGGASDGTTTIAWKIVTTANAKPDVPFETPPIAIWNDTTGSAVTATVEGIWGGGAVPLNSECFLEVQYLSDASSPMGGFVNDGLANLLAPPANQTSSSETWGGSTTAFKLSVTFTAQQKGWIYGRVKCAKASSTFYIDPLITLGI